MVITIGYRAIIIQTRSRRRDAKATQRSRSAQGKTALIVAPALGEHVQRHVLARLARHEIHHTGVRISAIDRRLRSANHFDVIQKIRGNVRKIDVAAKAVDGNPIDLHQAEIVVAAADK